MHAPSEAPASVHEPCARLRPSREELLWVGPPNLLAVFRNHTTLVCIHFCACAGAQPGCALGCCQTVPMTPSILYQCYCTLEPGGSQGGTRWRGGLKINAAAAGGQWAG